MKKPKPIPRARSSAKKRPRARRWRWSVLVEDLPDRVVRYARAVLAGTVKDPVTRYAADVIVGTVIAGPFVRQACARHLRDLGRKDLCWKVAAARHAINYFQVVLKLNGEGFEGVAFSLSPHQAFRIGALYGWVRLDGSRRFNYAYVEEGKGNGKSPELAGLGIKGLTGDGIPRAEIYFAAPKKDQAMIPFRDAVAMVDQAPALRDAILKSGKNPCWQLSYQANGSFARPVANDDRASGPRPYMALFEELHEHRDSSVVDMLMAGQKGRKNFLCYAITNSGVWGEESLCWEWRQKSLGVLAARSPTDAGWDDSWFAYVASVDEGEDPLVDESCWVKANPNLGVSIRHDYLRNRVTVAKTMPRKEGEVRRLNFCQWVEAVSDWIGLDAWDACKAAVDPLKLVGRSCFASLDLSSTKDFTALVLVFPEIEGDPLWYLLPFLFIPEETLKQRVGRDRNVPYEVWRDRGLIHVTPGNSIDSAYIRHTFQEQAKRFRFVECPYDRWNAATLVTQLQDDGFTMVPIGQGYETMTAPVKKFEELVLKQKVAHGGHEVLRWMLRNVKIRPGPAEAAKPDKEKSTERIDGIVAALGGVARGMVVPLLPQQSIYETRGILRL